MNDYFLIAIVVMIFVLIFQIAKASEYVSILKGEERSKRQTNRVNGFFLFKFILIGRETKNGFFFIHREKNPPAMPRAR